MRERDGMGHAKQKAITIHYSGQFARDELIAE